MQQPTRLISTPFAQEGEKTEIQNVTGEFDNSATYRLGFPPLTMQSIRLGGKPPKGMDFNGVLFDITENISFLCKGGRYQYNAGLSALIGGYPEGSNLLLDDNVTEVVSTVAGNQNNPNTDMTGWTFKPNRTTAEYVLDASGESQQQVNYNGGSKWHSRVDGYLENERVVLTNGDIVKSTIDGNTNDPNVDMTGWKKESSQISFKAYNDLRNYNGSGDFSSINGRYVEGRFYLDTTDSTSADNDGTIIVDAKGGRWKRIYSDGLDPRWFGAKGDGASDDSDAFLKLLDVCATINNTGGTPVIKMGSGDVYKITYNPVPVGVPTDIYDDPRTKSFYYLSGTKWLSTFINGVEKYPELRIEGNGATIICDGNDYSWFFSAGRNHSLIISNLQFKSSGRSATAGCILEAICIYSYFENVTFAGFSKGVALNIPRERNTLINCNFKGNGVALRLGWNKPGYAREQSQANENRFFGCNFVENGYAYTDEESQANGFVEIWYAECPVFVGGTWKSNFNPLIISATSGAIFDGIYFENLEGELPRYGSRAFMILNARNASIYTNCLTAAIRSVSFRNCYIGSFNHIAMRAGVVDGYQYHIDGVTFDNCEWGANAGFLYAGGEEAFIHNIRVTGRTGDRRVKLASNVAYAQELTSPPQQQKMVFPTGTPTLQSFNALDIEYERPGYSRNNFDAKKKYTFDRNVVARGVESTGNNLSEYSFTKANAAITALGIVGSSGSANQPTNSGVAVDVKTAGAFIKLGNPTDEQGWVIQGAPYGIQKALRFALDDNTESLRVTNKGELTMAPSASAPLSVGATSGFFNIRAVNGAPTAVPQIYPGSVPMVIDSTNGKLWVYIGGVWKSALLT